MKDKKLLEITAKLFQRALTTQVENLSLAELPEDEKLTSVQLGCIRYIDLHFEPSVGEIADGLLISDAAAAKLIDRLVKREIIVREESGQDRRVLKIRLTPKGKNVLKKINDREERNFSAIIDRMAVSDVTFLQKGMVAFIKASLLKAEEIDEVCLRCGTEHRPECPGNTQYREITGLDRSKV